MARIEEATLFRADPKLQYPGALRGGPSEDEDDKPRARLGEHLGEVARSAKRRGGLSFLVMMICGALTVLGAIFAPRTYEAEARVLVQQTRSVSGAAAAHERAEGTGRLGREYEEQVKARDNILALVKQTNLVARWDEMRQPHRRLIDKINHELSKPAPTDDEKLAALVSNIDQRLTVRVDATTVTIKIEWSHADSAREIVDAAVKNFMETRFRSEVGVLPAQLEMKAGFVAQAQKDLEAAASDLVRLQSAAGPSAPNAPRSAAEVIAPSAPKSVHEAQVRFDTATATLQTLIKQLQELRIELLDQRAQYANRYKITRPAEVPAGPKQPVALIAIALGILATIATVLVVAALADRSSGLFYEPRKVRDRLGLPVFAAFS